MGWNRNAATPRRDSPGPRTLLGVPDTPVTSVATRQAAEDDLFRDPFGDFLPSRR